MAKIKKGQLGLKKEIPGTRKPLTRAEKDSTIKSWQKIMQAGADSTFRKPKKAQEGFKSRSVERSPDGNYKMITKEKVGPGIKSKVVKEKRTLKGLLRGAPKTSGVLDGKEKQQRLPEANIRSLLLSAKKAKSGSKISKKKK